MARFLLAYAASCAKKINVNIKYIILMGRHSGTPKHSV